MIEVAYSREKRVLKAILNDGQKVVIRTFKILDVEYGGDGDQYKDTEDMSLL